MNKEIDGIKFQSVETDEQLCNYNMSRFIIFYEDITTRMQIGPPFYIFPSQHIEHGQCMPELANLECLSLYPLFQGDLYVSQIGTIG